MTKITRRNLARAGIAQAGTLGLYRYAPFYYYPGFNKPNGTVVKKAAAGSLPCQ